MIPCLIPARGGSKRFPRKNIAPLRGRPVLGWTVEAARASGVFSEVWVSTDDAEIAAVAAGAGAKVHDRSAALARDDATLVQVALDFADWLGGADGATPEWLAIVLPTAALLRPDDLRRGAMMMRERDADFVIAVTTYLESPFQALEDVEGYLRLFFGSEYARQSQKLPPVVVDSGYFYFVRVTAMRETGSLYGERLVGCPIPRERSIDIDEPGHLVMAEALMAAAELRVVPAGGADARLLWEWANDPDVRANAFRTAPIPWDDHVRWWQATLASDDARVWILHEGARPVGQIRYTRAGSHAEVDFSVAASERGRGLGTSLLRLTAPLAREALGVSTLIGHVKVENAASQRAFARADYTRTGPVDVRGAACFTFIST